MVSDNLLEFAAKIYDFDKATLSFISNSTNQIYVFQKSRKYYILRFSNGILSHTKAEMEWLFYLSKNNIRVGLPLKTIHGELVTSMQDSGKNFIITSFAVVTGMPWDKNNPQKWNNQIFYNWGKTMGDIHHITKDFVFSSDVVTRDTFNGRFALSDSVKTCPSVNAIVEDLISEIMELPKDKNSYGLIHNDMHQWNFHVDENNINVFDFDDSLYGWYALDIGIALYHGLWWGRKDNDGNDFTNNIIKNFLDGYLSANKLSDFWIAKIPMFMTFRQICKFSWFFDPTNIDEHQRERIYNIENNILFTDCKIDFSLFKQ